MSEQVEERGCPGMTPEQVRPGTRVRIMEHYRVEACRGLKGTVVARYGGEAYVAVDVRLADGERRLFWPSDLEQIPGQRTWWSSMLGRHS